MMPINIERMIHNADRYGGVTARPIICTPTLARAILELNTHNRKISKAVVQKYVCEILNGEWYMVPAGIGIDSNGVLSDGQHRLTAIVQANTPVPILIVTGLPPANQEKVDRQNKRSVFDALKLSGIDCKRKSVQIATILARFAVFGGRTGVPSDSDIKAALESHADAIDAVVNAMPSRSSGLTSAGVLTALVHGWELDPIKTADFMDGLLHPTMMTHDDPRYRLRKYLMESRIKTSGSFRQSNDYQRTAYALNAWFAGKKINSIRTAETIEMP